ncbi:MAG: SMP-30/gluconolactonase/LRE family protein [Acidiphilium sp.]
MNGFQVAISAKSVRIDQTFFGGASISIRVSMRRSAIRQTLRVLSAKRIGAGRRARQGVNCGQIQIESEIVPVAYPMVSPNGIGLSPDGKTVYVAETETARLWAFDLEAPGRPRRHGFPSPNGGRLVCGLGGYQRFDSLAVAASGNICVATLVTGCITIVSPGGEVLDQVKTGDPMTTNIAFGGADMRTAYLTLSATYRRSWPHPML